MAVLPAGPVNPNDLMQLLADEPKVLARVAIDRRASPPRMLHMRIQVPGERRPSAPLWYPYPEVGFWIGVISGHEAANWIMTGAVLPDGTAPLVDPIPTDRVVMNANRHPSRSRSPWLSSEWPFVRAEWHCTADNAPQARFLVGPGLPFFAHSDAAIIQLVYEVSEPPTGNASAGLRIDWQDRTARIGPLFITQDEIKVPIRGHGVSGLQLGVGSESVLTWSNRRINRTSTRRVQLKNGIPSPLWVVLSKDSQWLDYRYLQQTPTGWHTDTGDVEFEPPDMVTQVRAWTAGWETETLEFKETIRTDTLLKTVAAFANGDGGILLFGVADESREIVGLGGTPDEVTRALIDKIHSKVEPTPDISADICCVDEKLVLVAAVSPGEHPPYGVRIDQGHIVYYVRHGSSTYEARPADLNRFIEQRVGRALAARTGQQGMWGRL